VTEERAAGFLARDSILNRDTVSPLHFPTVVLRATSFDYDRRGRTINALNLVGKQDRQNSLFTGLGYLRRSSYQDVSGVVGCVVAFSSTDTLTWDALGNQLTSRTTTTATANSRPFERYTDGGTSFGLQPNVGRHVQTTRPTDRQLVARRRGKCCAADFHEHGFDVTRWKTAGGITTPSTGCASWIIAPPR